MNKFAKLGLGMLFACCIVSCDDDDNNDSSWVSDNVKTTFTTMYPEARGVEWESKGAYAVADFHDGNEKEAWYGKTDGQWLFTETDIRYNDLPTAVRDSLTAGEYGAWRVDDVDMLERPGIESVYIVEVENYVNGVETEISLYYSVDGVLLKTTAGSTSLDGNTQATLTTTMKNFVAERYPDARIVDIERENALTEIEIIDGGVKRDVYFDSNGEWLRTTTDLRTSQLPTAVTDRVATDYPTYYIDDAELVETATDSWYEVELEDRNDHELKVRINADGTLRTA